MFTLLFIMVFLIPYLAVGARFSRNRYAEITHGYANVDYSKIQANRKRITQLDKALTEMGSTDRAIIRKYHSHSCDKSQYAHVGVCNCGAVKRNRDELIRLNDYNNGVGPEPKVIGPMLFWPTYKTTAYLKGGKVNKPNYSLIEELERQELN